MTHDELVEIGRRWAFQRSPIVLTELASGAYEIPDVLAFDAKLETGKWARSLVIECKTSRSDFLADRKKLFREYPDRGMGQHRMFLAPKGLLDPGELPDGWGLLEVTDAGKCRLAKKTTAFDWSKGSEITVLMSVIRRCGRAIADSGSNVSIRAYSIESKAKATLTVWRTSEDEVRLLEEIIDAQDEGLAVADSVIRGYEAREGI